VVVSWRIKADKEVVLAAVMQDGSSLEYASDNLKADKEVVLAAVAQNMKSLCLASANLREGGMRIYMDGLALARRSLLTFLLAARYYPLLNESSEGLTPSRPRTAPAGCVLYKLNSHGFYFALKSKHLISVFVGAPVGKTLAALNTAFRRLK
jgi:hypothetical protein